MCFGFNQKFKVFENYIARGHSEVLLQSSFNFLTEVLLAKTQLEFEWGELS